jgi:WD40 repeat protein
VESLQVIVSNVIQYFRYVYKTPNLSPFCTFSVLFCRQAGEFGPTVQTRRLCDLHTHTCLATLTGHHQPVTALALVCPTVLASESADKSIKLWQLE